jgi:hypothetical protein
MFSKWSCGGQPCSECCVLCTLVGAINLRVSLPSAERVVARGSCMRLGCSSVPRGPVQWARVDRQPLRSASLSCSSSSFSSSSPSPCGQHGEGVLLVEGVGGEDEGHYMCTASLQNQTATRICHVVVGGKRETLTASSSHLAYCPPSRSSHSPGGT